MHIRFRATLILGRGVSSHGQAVWFYTHFHSLREGPRKNWVPCLKVTCHNLCILSCSNQMQGTAYYQNQSDKAHAKLLPNLAICCATHNNINSLAIENETAEQVIPNVL